MPRKITPATSLDTLRKEAKRWLKEIRANSAEARARFAAAYPTAPATPTLRDVQHALAREYGHESWVALKKAVEQPDVERATPMALAQTAEEYDRLASDLVLAFDAQDQAALDRSTRITSARSRRRLWAEVWRRVYAFRQRSSKVPRTISSLPKRKC